MNDEATNNNTLDGKSERELGHIKQKENFLRKRVKGVMLDSLNVIGIHSQTLRQKKDFGDDMMFFVPDGILYNTLIDFLVHAVPLPDEILRVYKAIVAEAHWMRAEMDHHLEKGMLASDNPVFKRFMENIAERACVGDEIVQCVVESMADDNALYFFVDLKGRSDMSISETLYNIAPPSEKERLDWKPYLNHPATVALSLPLIATKGADPMRFADVARYVLVERYFKRRHIYDGIPPSDVAVDASANSLVVTGGDGARREYGGVYVSPERRARVDALRLEYPKPDFARGEKVSMPAPVYTEYHRVVYHTLATAGVEKYKGIPKDNTLLVDNDAEYEQLLELLVSMPLHEDVMMVFKEFARNAAAINHTSLDDLIHKKMEPAGVNKIGVVYQLQAMMECHMIRIRGDKGLVFNIGPELYAYPAPTDDEQRIVKEYLTDPGNPREIKFMEGYTGIEAQRLNFMQHYNHVAYYLKRYAGYEAKELPSLED